MDFSQQPSHQNYSTPFKKPCIYILLPFPPRLSPVSTFYCRLHEAGILLDLANLAEILLKIAGGVETQDLKDYNSSNQSTD